MKNKFVYFLFVLGNIISALCILSSIGYFLSSTVATGLSGNVSFFDVFMGATTSFTYFVMSVYFFYLVNSNLSKKW